MELRRIGSNRTASSESADVSGFDAIYRAELAGVTRVAYLIVRSEAVAEELAQEAFLRLYHHFGEVENPAGFLRTAVSRLALTWRKRNGMERERLRLAPPPQAVVAVTEEHRIDETWTALGRLNPDRAAVLVLRFYEDLSFDEIGRIVEASPATVRSRCRRALADLRRELERMAR